MPKFSIVIPTKNRPDYLRASIYSALNQSFMDLEVIVSDNHNDERTQRVLDEFKDTRFRAVKPDVEMNMPNHWEFATKHAQGEFVLLLADRKVLFANALKLMVADPNLESLDVAAVGVKVFDDQKRHMGWSAPIPKSRWFTTRELVENFLYEDYFSDKTYDSFFPKTLNGMFKNEHATRVREKSGHYFNIPNSITPDYSSFFANSALLEKSYYFGFPVILTQGEAVSHGRNFAKGDYTGYMQSLGLEDPYCYVPFKAPFIHTLLYQDFFAVRECLRGNLVDLDLDWRNYLRCNFLELKLKIAADILSDQQKMEFEKMLSNAISELIHDAEEKTKFQQELSNMEFKRGTLKPGLIKHLVDHIKYRYSHVTLVNKLIKYRFASALAAAGF